ncbi:dehydratase [Denitratisoma sp. DHT3]|uniref:MaoC family dehydratase n=1 Tax=Denitratisoma sp. DHT3 TaxID=1981880 RepID=UPI001198862F|nr:MaoC family dehydratase [Denitratisoma sp. DHT3]QDX80562.1 dehydratase [Denitratisoma sp. DHT3]
MAVVFNSNQSVIDLQGKELGTSDWLAIEQDRINQFADATGDHQWIHVDPVKAKDGPFGACIAHGYLTLSLVNYFMPQVIALENMKMGVNYGCEKIRFPNTVKVGSRVRGRCELIKAEPAGEGVQATIRVTVEIEGQERPACVADTISRYFFN